MSRTSLECAIAETEVHPQVTVSLLFVCPAGGGSSEGAAAADQAAKSSAEETIAERRSQSCDEIKEREPEHHQVKHRGRLFLGMNGTALLERLHS